MCFIKEIPCGSDPIDPRAGGFLFEFNVAVMDTVIIVGVVFGILFFVELSSYKLVKAYFV